MYKRSVVIRLLLLWLAAMSAVVEWSEREGVRIILCASPPNSLCHQAPRDSRFADPTRSP